MKTFEEFEAFYNSELISNLKEIDKVRKKNLRDGLICTFIFLAAIGGSVAVILAAELSNGWKVGIIIGLLVIAVVLCIPSFKRLSKYNYKSRFKKKVIEPIIHFISDDLSYSPKNFISQQDFINSRLFLQKIDRYKGDDFVEGFIDKTKFHFSEIKAEYVTRRKNQKSYHTIFKGIFFIADFNKSFEGSTVLLPNYLGGGLTFLKKISGITRREKFVKLEDNEFMRNFNCYSDDDVKARYILSPALMQRLNDFKDKYPKNPIYISFVDDHIYVGVSHTKDLFEPTYFTTIINFEKVKSYFEDVKLTVDIVEELNLNTRIWTKK